MTTWKKMIFIRGGGGRKLYTPDIYTSFTSPYSPHPHIRYVTAGGSKDVYFAELRRVLLII